jgi:hypothetical protein
MPTISPDDDALDRRVRAIVEAVDACRRALIDLTIEDKLLAVERLGSRWKRRQRIHSNEGTSIRWAESALAGIAGSAALERRLRRCMTDDESGVSLVRAHGPEPRRSLSGQNGKFLL